MSPFKSPSKSPSKKQKALLKTPWKERIEKSLASRSLRKDVEVRGTYDKKILYKFVEKYRDKIQQDSIYTILLFIDQDTHGVDIEEWRSFSKQSQAFEDIGFKILGVSTIRAAELRTLFRNYNLNIPFPIIVDTSRPPLSGSFGFYFLDSEIDKTIPVQELPNLNAKAVAVLDDKMKLFYTNVRLDPDFIKAENLYFTLMTWRKKHEESEAEIKKQSEGKFKSQSL